MEYVEYGVEQRNIIIFLHGGGLGSWNFREEAEQLKEKFHVIVPVLDGHSGSDRDFTTIESNANEIIDFIDQKCSGSVFMIGGLSLGGQILVEILSKRTDICRFAIIESTLVVPMPATYALIQPTFSLCYPLVKKRWFAKLQFHSLHIKKAYFEEYYRDSAAITKENMIAFLRENSNYKLKNTIEACQIKILILVGSRESNSMKKSAEILHKKLPNASLEILPGFFHGDLSINHCALYIQKVLSLIN